MQNAQHQNLVGFIWNIANKLRGPYRPPQYRRVMLPLIVLRRFDQLVDDMLRRRAVRVAHAEVNDVFATIWKPLNEKDERQNSYRRQLQRAYVNCLGGTLNPDKKDMESINYKAFQSDAVLYVAAHLTKVENYVKEQIPNYAAGTINHLHYTNLFLMIKKIKDKYTQADKD